MADEENRQQEGKEEPIIIKKKKGGGGGGHHGGSWKVAYADFVTAMMALFIVLWILGQSEEIKESVEHYFSHTEEYSIFTGKRGNILVDLGLKPSQLGEGKGIQKGKGWGEDKAEVAGKDDEKHEFTFWVDWGDSTRNKSKFQAMKDSARAAKRVERAASKLKEEFKEMLAERPELKEIISSLRIEITKEGMRIELIETKGSVFFKIGSAEITKDAKDILKKLSKEIGKLPNPVEIEGHTDSRKYSPNSSYTNWELSADRANATRKAMEKYGLWEGQVIKITGYADRKLRKPENPFDITNRRISILVRNLKSKAFLSSQEDKVKAVETSQ